MTDVVNLIGQTFTKDNLGVETATETTRTVMCEVTSVSQAEFFAAANTELNPELRFTVFFGDYENESVIEYSNARYSIYRTYRSGDYMELYAERKIGS